MSYGLPYDSDEGRTAGRVDGYKMHR